MDDKESQKVISQVIYSSFSSNLTIGGSKLSQLQQFYEQKQLRFKDYISETGRTLTRKIFGSGVRCIHPSKQQKQFSNCSSLICLGYILLTISFKDQYVMRLTIEQLNKCQDVLTKMLQINNPYKSLGINGDNLQKIFVEILLKINSWRSNFTIGDILKDYYVASETYSIFLRAILCKLGFKNAENFQKNLDCTEEIFSILCEYFDLNVIAHKSGTLKRKYLSVNSTVTGEKAQLYLFNSYNLFVSTADNEQFCCGRYYSNQTQLLTNEKQLTRSTFQFVLKCKQANQKDQHDQKQEKGDKIDLRMSQTQIDLGLSNSALIFGQAQTPYFNGSSNAQTPQFGQQLLDSMRFRRSMDFDAALRMVQNRQNAALGTVQQQNLTDNIQRQNANQYFYNMQDDNSLNNIQTDKNVLKITIRRIPNIPSQKVFENNQIQRQLKTEKKDEDQELHNKPRSPPSIQSIQRNILDRSYDENSRQLTFQQRMESEDIIAEMIQKEKNQENSKMMKKKEGYPLNGLKIPEIGKKSLIDNNNSDMRSQSKFEYFEQRQINQFVNLSVKQSQFFPKTEENIIFPNQAIRNHKRKDASSRKYSVNEVITNDNKQFKNNERNIVHYSNHFQKLEEEDEQGNNKSRKTEMIGYNNQPNPYWQYASFDKVNSACGLRTQKKKMQFNSNIVNLQFCTKKNEEKTNNKEEKAKQKSILKYSKNANLKKNVEEREKRNEEMKAKLTGIKVSKNPNVNNIDNNFNKAQSVSENKQFSSKRIQPQLNLKEKEQVIKAKEIDSNRNRKTPRKNSKFPQFLRNCKSRKTINHQDQYEQNIGVSINFYNNNIQSTEGLRFQKPRTPNKRTKTPKQSIENSQKKILTSKKYDSKMQQNLIDENVELQYPLNGQQYNIDNPNSSETHIVKNKHTRSYPQISPIPDPNANPTCPNTINSPENISRPWLHFARSVTQNSQNYKGVTTIKIKKETAQVLNLGKKNGFIETNRYSYTAQDKLIANEEIFKNTYRSQQIMNNQMLSNLNMQDKNGYISATYQSKQPDYQKNQKYTQIISLYQQQIFSNNYPAQNIPAYYSPNSEIKKNQVTVLTASVPSKRIFQQLITDNDNNTNNIYMNGSPNAKGVINSKIFAQKSEAPGSNYYYVVNQRQKFKKVEQYKQYLTEERGQLFL